MRDSDCDLTSVVVVRADSPIETVADLRGKVVATGAVDSPQATLLPLDHLRSPASSPATFTVRRFDVGVGLHGDHIGGEREAARALVAGEVDAACMIDGNHLLFGREGTLPAGSTRVIDTDRALRPLQHDGDSDGAGRPGRPLRRAAAGHGLRRPRGPAAARPRRPQAVAARSAQGLRSPRARRRRRSASTTQKGAVTAADYRP